MYNHGIHDRPSLEGLEHDRINSEMNDQLESEFTEEEIRCAVFSISKEKAPGIDGFSLGFYQECWDVIKSGLLNVFDEFHKNGIINRNANSTPVLDS